MVAHAKGFPRNHTNDGTLVAQPPLPTPQPTGPGFIIGLTRSWPASDLMAVECLRRLRALIDCNHDGQDDTEVTVSIAFLDVDANGKIERGIDALLVTPTDLKLVDPTVPLNFGDADRHATAVRVVRMLAGAEGL